MKCFEKLKINLNLRLSALGIGYSLSVRRKKNCLIIKLGVQIELGSAKIWAEIRQFSQEVLASFVFVVVEYYLRFQTRLGN